MADADRDPRRAAAASVSPRDRLPRGRAFVLQLSADSDPPRGRLAGRLVHLESGDAIRFDGLDHLLRLLARAGDCPAGSGPTEDS